MAATDHLSTGQLRMFIPAKELIQAAPWEHDKDYVSYDRTPVGQPERLETNAELWDRKAEESWEPAGRYEPSLRSSIEAQGVKRPVGLHHEGRWGTVVGGHHRIAAANEIDPEMLVPVQHYGMPEWTPKEAMRKER